MADEPPPEWMPTLTMDRQIAAARKSMGEQRWQQLNAEWTAAEPVQHTPVSSDRTGEGGENG